VRGGKNTCFGIVAGVKKGEKVLVILGGRNKETRGKVISNRMRLNGERRKETWRL